MLLSGAIKTHLFSFFLPLGAMTPGAFLATPLPNPPSISSAELEARGRPAAPANREPVPEMPRPPVPDNPSAGPATDRLVGPNSDGVIDLAALDAADSPGTLPNPFVVRYRPPASVREFSLTIGGVLISKNARNACLICNGDIYSPGDALAGLTLTSIAADGIELRADGVRLQIPVSDRPVRLRLPR